MATKKDNNVSRDDHPHHPHVISVSQDEVNALSQDKQDPTSSLYYRKPLSFTNIFATAPLTFLGGAAVIGTLGYGLVSMFKGQQARSTRAMGWRVGLQAFTLATVVWYFTFSSTPFGDKGGTKSSLKE
eukprot:TRINITY_DN247_c0_g1_i1.p1 TRINITY_DN247_c0_g1~~TRINITY_DN247_c0_g1_i1.p1  ORF type:complete len:148 (-),score=39.75 TRINITY_DN247_c0_g1_i1:59-442(-)